MEKAKHMLSAYLPFLHTVFVIVWLNNLAHTDAYFLIYIILAVVSFYLQSVSKSDHREDRHGLLTGMLSVLFSVLVLLSNYPIFVQVRDPALMGRSTNLMVNLINSGLTLIGGVFVAHPILRWWFNRDQIPANSQTRIFKNKLFSVAVFSVFVLLNFVHLFFVEYPGNLSQDTFTQIGEMISGQYSNFNTFWHTVLFQGVLSAGYFLFHDVNAAVAFFCCFQILVLSFAFTYTLVTMDRLGCSKGFVAASFLLYLLIPYNMALAVTIWKDVLFAAGCLLLVTSLLRIMKLPAAIWDYMFFAVGSLLFLISRTNGWIIYLVFSLLNLMVNRSNKKLLALTGSLAVFGWFLLNPMLSILHVSGGDRVESLSVPIQQVSRVIADGCALSEEDTALLSKVIDVEEVPELYTEWLSDPMKVEVRSKDYDYFLNHFGEYRSLWIRLGVKYPWEYIKAWVDQTKGYWNAGYDYAMYSEYITDNPYGIEKSAGGNPVASLFRLYFGLSRHVVFFEPFHSIGLHVWIMILCVLYNILKKRGEWILSVPVLLLIIGLWLGTPVYACFRYVYPLFVCFPLILSTTLYSAKQQQI